MPLAAVDWTQVLIALVAGLPAIIAAVAAVLVHRQIRTPSARPIGEQVESALQVGVGNAYRIESVRKATGAALPVDPPTPTPAPPEPANGG